MSQSIAQALLINHFIGGKPAQTASGRTGPVWNPATGQQIAEVNFASAEEVNHAVAIAKAAFPAWRATPLSRRAEIMFKFRSLIDQHRERLAEIISTENGKTLADARGELARGLENVEFACGIPSLLKGSYSEQSSTGVDVYQLRQPLGVVAGITPFNFPAMVPLWMLTNAIACGNTFVLKPSEKVPSASLLLADLAHQAGVPSGVLNVVQGDRVAVDRLLAHPDVKAISFVGSTPIARYIYETGTRNGKRVQALGGAKNHMLVLPDADIEAAADAAISAGYGAAGQRCMAISVIVAVGAVADPLVAAIRKRIPNIKIGPGLEAGSEMGPLVTREQRDRVASIVTSAETGRRDARRRWPRRGHHITRRLFPGRLAHRQRRARNALLRRRDLRPRPDGRSREHLRRRPEAYQRESLRQWHRHFYAERWRCPPISVRCRSRHGRH